MQRRIITTTTPGSTAPYPQHQGQQQQHGPQIHGQQGRGRGYGGGAPQWRGGTGTSGGFTKRSDDEDLNLDQFLSEADAAERRRLIDKTRQLQQPPR